MSILLKMIMVGMLYDSAATRKRSRKTVVVSGWCIVKTNTAWSMLAAMMCDCLERLVDLRIMQLRRSCMLAIVAGSIEMSNSTISPTATGFVEL